MGLIGSFFRLVGGIILFVVVLVLGIVFAPQLGSTLAGLPGTITIGNVEIPLLASIVVSVVGTLLINLIALPFRRASEA